MKLVTVGADYQASKHRLNMFVLNEIDNGQLTDVQIAKMLLDVSMHYLKHPTVSKRDYDGDLPSFPPITYS